VKAFVTGATGFLGRHLIEHLLAQGDDVTALVRTFDRARALPAGARPWAGDVTQPEGLRSGMRGAEVVYHLAAIRQPGRRASDRGRLDLVNVEGARGLLGLAGELGVGRFVHVSDLHAINSPGGAPSAYGASKRRAHAAMAQAMRDGLPVTLACPGALVGAGDAGWLGKLLGRYARRRLWVGVGGESAYGFLSAREAAAGLRLAAARGIAGETYALAGPSLTLRQFFAEAQLATGLPAPYGWLPAAWARLTARALERVRPDWAEAASHYAGRACPADGTQAERNLGWRAERLNEALRASVRWHPEQERLRRAAARMARERASVTEESP
jgi:nucleoside-diphosphate-sugar epimerase